MRYTTAHFPHRTAQSSSVTRSAPAAPNWSHVTIAAAFAASTASPDGIVATSKGDAQATKLLLYADQPERGRSDRVKTDAQALHDG